MIIAKVIIYRPDGEIETYTIGHEFSNETITGISIDTNQGMQCVGIHIESGLIQIFGLPYALVFLKNTGEK